MIPFILRRLLLTIPVLLGVSLLTFAIIQVTPGDPARLMLGDFASPEQIAAARQQLGLDDPLWLQYGRHAGRAVRGDLGASFRSREPVLDEILARLPSTLALMLTGMTVALLIGTLGIGGIVVATAGLSATSGWERSRPRRSGAPCSTPVAPICAQRGGCRFFLARRFLSLYSVSTCWPTVCARLSTPKYGIDFCRNSGLSSSAPTLTVCKWRNYNAEDYQQVEMNG